MLRWICLFLAIAVPAFSEESPALVSFRAAMTSRGQILRDYAADGERSYEFKNGKLSEGGPRLHQFAAFTAKKVKRHGDWVDMEGTRTFIVKDAITHALVPAGLDAPMKIHLKVDDPDFERALPAAASQLFFDSYEAAAQAVPGSLAHLVPAVYNSETKAYVDCKTCKPVSPARDEGIFDLDPEAMSGVTPPRLTHQVDPDFHPSHFKGIGRQAEALYGMVIDESGSPTRFWLLKPIGTPLDWDGFEAVSQYRFAPSTKDGKPVPVRLNVAVNFQLLDRAP